MLAQLINIECDEHYEFDILILNNNMVLVQVQNLILYDVIPNNSVVFLYLNHEDFNTLHHKIII